MTDLSAHSPDRPGPGLPFLARPGVQRWAARFPLTRPFVRREGAEIFDLVQGFVASQTLAALVELNILEELVDGPAHVNDLGLRAGVPADRMQVLLQAGAALGVLRRRRKGRFALSSRGAALLGVPGLKLMILHHRAFWDDLRDPVALLRDPSGSALSQFWPYVMGATAKDDADTAARYSTLMAESQELVAQDTLDLVPLNDAEHIMDIGGGSGAFLAAVAGRYAAPHLTLFDLPDTAPSAQGYLTQAGVLDRVALSPGSFRSDPLPTSADVITLIRVCYDHEDNTVLALLRAIHAALPAGGRLILSEPMSGGARPDPITDVYFALYTMAMGTGRTRSAKELTTLLRQAGFAKVSAPRSRRSYVTSVLQAVKAG
ncbi:MAG: methyltransferase domain-containing protein [Rhodobacteraceae bacterium]|nr:methyltransferase domain-containing protein [Paracoccaceae bacterium]